MTAARPLALLSLAALLAAAGCSGGKETSSVAAGCQGSWALVAGPSGGKGLFDVEAFAPDDVWAVGERTGSAATEALVEHWDGTRWAVVPGPAPGSDAGSLSAVAGAGTDDVWAVGYVSAGDAGENTPLAQHWDGSAWEFFPVPAAAAGIDLTDVSVASADDAWAVGASPAQRGRSRDIVLHWDGSAWQVAPSPRGEKGLLGVSAAAADDVWAVGFSVDATTQETRTLVQHWDGSAWQIVPAPSPGSLSVLYRVEAIAADDVWAVGSSSGDGPGAALIEHWDGSSWEVVQGPVAASALISVAAAATDDVWSVGYGGDGALIARWDGTAWDAVDGAPSRGALEGIATIPGGEVWAVGEDGSAPLRARFACAARARAAASRADRPWGDRVGLASPKPGSGPTDNRGSNARPNRGGSVLSWSSNTDRGDNGFRCGGSPFSGQATPISEQPPSEVLLAVDTAAAAIRELSAGGVELRVVVGHEPRRVWIELSRAGAPVEELAASRALDLLACGAVGELLAESRGGSSRPD